MVKVYIKTFGCQSNIADSEQIAGILKKNKYQIADNIEDSDVVILNSCAVKLRTQNRELDFIKNISKNKKLFIGGCLTKVINLRKYENKIEALFDTNSILNLPKIINKPEDTFSDKKEKRINIPRIRKNKDIAIINISQGCKQNCDYCATKIARGDLKSYSIDEIKKEAKIALKEGCRKIYLSSQDNGCYGFDIGTNIVNLLNELIRLKGDFKIRVGMMNPTHILPFIKELIQLYKSQKIIKFLHIPIQVGSNSLLKKIGRNYKTGDFEKIVKEFRKNISDITISTDVLIGHPLESESDFQKTLNLIKKIKPEVLNISKFAPRPGTRASKFKQLKTEEIKKRSIILTNLFKNLNRN